MAGFEAEAVDAHSLSLPARSEAPEPDYIAELGRLASLVDKGTITEEEFQSKKKSVHDL
jgi:hypothetical protein